MLTALALAPAAGALDFDEVVTRLDSDDLRTRDSAAEELRQAVGANEGDGAEARAIEHAAAEFLRTRNLTLEQRVRLIGALRDRFVESPRAAMGVQFVTPQRLPRGVELQMVMDGFPAKDLGILQAGDVVIEAAGISLLDGELLRINQRGMTQASERLRHIVISHDPGETIPMAVLRHLPGAERGANPGDQAAAGLPMGVAEFITEGPGKNAEVLALQVLLGSFNQLRQAQGGMGPDPYSLEGAWRERLRRLGVEPIEVASLDVPLEREDWMRHRQAIGWERPRQLRMSGGAADVGDVVGMANATPMRGQGAIVLQPPVQIPEGLQRRMRAANPIKDADVGGVKLNPKIVVGGREMEVGEARVEDITNLLNNIAALSKRRAYILRQADEAGDNKGKRQLAIDEARRVEAEMERLSQILSRKARQMNQEEKAVKEAEAAKNP
jgi:hypothetical protein